MKSDLFVLLFKPGDFYAPRSISAHPVAILKCDVSVANVGENALFHSDGDLIASEIITADGCNTIKPLSYQFHYFTNYHRSQKERSRGDFDAVFNNMIGGFRSEDLFPAIAIKIDYQKQVANLYHFNDTAFHGSIFLKYAQVTFITSEKKTSWKHCMYLLEQAYSRLLKYRHLLNDNCWYTRWKKDMELERKYTFQGIPDTWALNTELYRSINVDGRLTGFVPELDMDLQVFDYDNFMFEVIEPSAKGYISFIPQSNNKVAIKQKWFEQNAELRKESISYDCKLDMEEFETKAMELAGGEVRRLAPFRRKRFDVNFESLETGNIFGVYFDICRSLEEPDKYAFSQCEVEYCRSRTMYDYKDVMEEFERVCSYVKNFLSEKRISFEQDLFSKLDFSRETYMSQLQGRRQ